MGCQWDEHSIEELTVVSYDHKTLIIALCKRDEITERQKDEQTDKRTDERTDDQITRCHLSGWGHKKCRPFAILVPGISITFEGPKMKGITSLQK